MRGITNVQPDTSDMEAEIAALTEAVAGKQSKLKTASVILSVDGWSNYTQTVACDIVTADNIVWVAPAGNLDSYGGAGVFASAQGDGTLTFTCTETPTVALTVSIVTAD